MTPPAFRIERQVACGLLEHGYQIDVASTSCSIETNLDRNGSEPISNIVDQETKTVDSAL